MAKRGYILCGWMERLWPAKVKRLWGPPVWWRSCEGGAADVCEPREDAL